MRVPNREGQEAIPGSSSRRKQQIRSLTRRRRCSSGQLVSNGTSNPGNEADHAMLALCRLRRARASEKGLNSMETTRCGSPSPR